MAPGGFAADDRREVSLLLIFRSIFQQGGPYHGDAHATEWRSRTYAL